MSGKDAKIAVPAAMAPYTPPDAPLKKAAEEEAAARPAKSHLASQITAILQKNILVRLKRPANIGMILIEILVPIIFFGLLSVRELVKSNTPGQNNALDLLSFQTMLPTVGRPYPIMDIRWTSANESEGINYCSFAGGAGNSLTDIFSLLSSNKGSPKFSSAYQLLYTPMDENHEKLMKQAAKIMLCSRVRGVPLPLSLSLSFLRARACASPHSPSLFD